MNAMRKKFSIFCFVVFYSTCITTAQKYQNICSPGVTYYKTSSGVFGAFRLDTIHNPRVGDSLYISYTAIRETSGGYCSDITKGSVLGREVYKKHDGWIYLFVHPLDTVRIFSQAGLGQAWHFYDQPNYYLEARISSIIPDSVLGQTDTVKVISIQAKAYNGQNISHIFNNKQFRLSRHYGLSVIYDIGLIPDDTARYTLEGKSSPSLGLQDLDWQQVYDFNVGDEFHDYSYEDEYTTGGWRPNKQQWRIKQVLDKTVYGNNDSVDYHFLYCLKKWHAGSNGGTTTYSVDTVLERHNFHEPPVPGFDIRKLPSEFLPTTTKTWKYTGAYKFLYLPSKYMQGNMYYWSSTYNCYMVTDWILWTGEKYEYAKGLGMDYYYAIIPENYIEYFCLVYYKKGNKIFGTPVATSCNTLVNAEGLFPSTEARIYPNPGSASLKVEFPYPKCSFELYNETGTLIRKAFSMGKTAEINTSGLPSGIYPYLFLDKDKRVLSRGKWIKN